MPDPLTVGCPRCFAAAGSACKIRSDLRRFASVHKARRERAEQEAKRDEQGSR